MLNGFFVLCCFCRMHWEFTHFCNSMNTVATWFMFFPEGHWWKKASLILQFRPESNAEIPITSLKSLGRISSHLLQGFSNPHPRQNKKKLANKTIYEDVFKFKTSTLPYNLFRSNHLGQFFQVSQKTFPYQNNKTQNNGIHTPKKHTKIQTKQNTIPNKTTQNKTKLRLQANKIQNTKNNKHTKKI